jgi:hypothetical protein
MGTQRNVQIPTLSFNTETYGKASSFDIRDPPSLFEPRRKWRTRAREGDDTEGLNNHGLHWSGVGEEFLSLAKKIVNQASILVLCATSRCARSLFENYEDHHLELPLRCAFGHANHLNHPLLPLM